MTVALFRTLPLEEASQRTHFKALEVDLARLNTLASIKNPLTAEKRFVRSTYNTLALLAKLSPGVITLPAPQTAPWAPHQAPAPVFLSKRAFQILLKSPTAVRPWPTLAEGLAAQPTLQALHLFQWQSIHATAPQTFKAGLNL